MIDLTKNNRLIKIISIFSFLLIIIALSIILVTPPADGYEISIYDAFPWYFWVVLIGSFVTGILIGFFQIFSSYNKNFFLLGLSIIILSNIIFLLLPLLRGYGFFPLGDALTHVGWIKDISKIGKIGNSNFYPILHILGFNLWKITSLKINVIVNIMWISWSMMFLLNILLLSNTITETKKESALIILFSSPLIFSYFHPLIHPSMLSLMFMPLLLYFFYNQEKSRSNKISFTVLSILIIFVITFSHPVVNIFSIILLISLIFSRILAERFNSTFKTKIKKIPSKRRFIYPIILIITFFSWYLPYTRTQSSIKNVLTYFTQSGKENLYQATTSVLDVSTLSMFQIIKVFFFRYGAVFIYLGLVSIGLLTISKKIFIDKRKINFTLIDFSLIFLLSLIFSSYSLFAGTEEFNVIRISKFFVMTSPILIGLLFYSFTQKKGCYLNRIKKKKMYFILLFLIVCLVSSINYLNIYGSPLVVRNNFQVTNSEITGSGFVLSNNQKNIAISYIGGSISRFNDFIFGTETSEIEYIIIKNPNPLPPHFGYETNNSIKNVFNYSNHFLLIDKQGLDWVKVIPENVRSEAHIYLEDDLKKLLNDPFAISVYKNKEFGVWKTYDK